MNFLSYKMFSIEVEYVVDKYHDRSYNYSDDSGTSTNYSYNVYYLNGKLYPDDEIKEYFADE